VNVVLLTQSNTSLHYSRRTHSRVHSNHKRILFAWLSFSDSYSVFVNFVLHFIDK